MIQIIQKKNSPIILIKGIGLKEKNLGSDLEKKVQQTTEEFGKATMLFKFELFDMVTYNSIQKLIKRINQMNPLKDNIKIEWLMTKSIGTGSPLPGKLQELADFHFQIKEA